MNDHEFGSYAPNNVVTETYDGAHRRAYINSKLESTYPSSNRRSTLGWAGLVADFLLTSCLLLRLAYSAFLGLTRPAYLCLTLT